MACTQAMARLSPQTGATCIKVGSGCAAFNGRESPTTFATCLGIGEPVSKQDIDTVELFFQRNNSAWSTIDASDVADKALFALLLERNYQQVAAFQSWVRPLSGTLPPAPNPEIEIRHVPAKDSAVWARTVASGFVGTENIPQPMLVMYTALAFASYCHAFLAYQEGEPVGGGVLMVRNDMAFLRTTAIKAGHRRKGIQSALIAHRLRFAASKGCSVAFCSTEPEGTSARNLQKFGFAPHNQSFVFRKQL